MLWIDDWYQAQYTTQPDDEDGDEKEEGEDLDQVLESQQTGKQAPASHFDAGPDHAGNSKPKKKAKTVGSASAEFKPPSRSGSQPSRGIVASLSGGGCVARSLNTGLVMLAAPKKM